MQDDDKRLEDIDVNSAKWKDALGLSEELQARIGDAADSE